MRRFIYLERDCDYLKTDELIRLSRPCSMLMQVSYIISIECASLRLEQARNILGHRRRRYQKLFIGKFSRLARVI